MYWIALWPTRDDALTAWSWWALRFSPRVARLEEALLVEIAASQRLFGGRRHLVQQLTGAPEPLPPAIWAGASTSVTALGLLRLKRDGRAVPKDVPDGLPLDVLTAAHDARAALERTGCRTWGDLRRLPRAGLSRRFGAALLDALDTAWQVRPDQHEWIALPDRFALGLELPALASTATDLLEAGQHLLDQLQLWLQARHHGVLAFELEWTLDLRRLDGVALPRHEQLVIRTAQPAQEMQHLRRLLSEQLARTRLSAPANHLWLRTRETVPWSAATASFLPEDRVQGERLHQLVERLSARLGPDAVVVPTLQADHRPEHRQRWVPAVGRTAAPSKGRRADDALYPTWMLPTPLELAVRRDTPHYGGPLRLVSRPHRIEAAWWDPQSGGPALRDYFVARSEEAGLVWIYRERPSNGGEDTAAHARWFLQGLYA